MVIFRKSRLESRIAEVERELKAVSREIRVQERIFRREKRLAGCRPGDGKKGEGRTKDRGEASSRRLASYLSAGSFQTTAHPKFRSDLVRRRRLLIGGAVADLAAAAWIIWKTLF